MARPRKTTLTPGWSIVAKTTRRRGHDVDEEANDDRSKKDSFARTTSRTRRHYSTIHDITLHYGTPFRNTLHRTNTAMHHAPQIAPRNLKPHHTNKDSSDAGHEESGYFSEKTLARR